MKKPWSEYLKVHELISVAQVEFKRSTGGADFNPSEIKCVMGHFGNAWNAELYVEDSEAVPGFVFGCALVVALVRGHCLKDGNKRLGWLALTLIITRLDMDITASTDDVERFILAIISDKLERQGVASWLQPRLVSAQSSANTD